MRSISTTLAAGLLGSVLLWAAFPPLDLPWLAWIAPLPWLWLVRLPTLPGRWPYVALWLAGLAHWLAMLQGIRLAHPALYLGWFALSAYLAVYLPVFVGLTRLAVHRLNLPLILAAPVVWVGLEFLRGQLLTGFSMALLAHTQADFPRLIQISDLAGGYTLSFLIMLVAACLARMAPMREGEARTREGEAPAEPATPRQRQAQRAIRPPGQICWWPLIPAIAAIAATLAYGSWRLAQTPPGTVGRSLNVALIQGSLDTVFEVTAERVRLTYEHYEGLTARATAARPNLDLVVWPESMFMVPERRMGGLSETADAIEDSQEAAGQQVFRDLLAREAALANSHTDADERHTLLIIGTTTYEQRGGGTNIYNSALLADRTGQVIARYYKMHPVMFGEYIPLADRIEWLNRITPIEAGLSAGDAPSVFDVAGLRLSPSICFESAVPHLIRRQLVTLARRGTPADALINITNDGWFWGSAILDLHFRCGVFRAVENRKPLIVAANTGISAWVDGSGVIRQRGPRRQPEVILASVQADGRASPYHGIGDWPAAACAAICLLLAAMTAWNRPRSPAN